MPARGLPEIEPLPRYGQLVLIGDLLAPLEEIQALVAASPRSGLRGHLLQVLDPAEETLPFDGRVRFEGLEREDPLLISRVETVRDDYAERWRGIAPGSPRSRAPPAGASPPTAPTDRRIPRCWRSMRRWPSARS